MKNNKFPPFIKGKNKLDSDSALRLDVDRFIEGENNVAYYYRDGGHYHIRIVRSLFGTLTISDVGNMAHANGREMVACSYEYWKESNGEYATTDSEILKELGIQEQECMNCGAHFAGGEPQRCCSGWECACGGQPIEPVVCSKNCYEELTNGKKKTMGDNSRLIIVDDIEEGEFTHIPEDMLQSRREYGIEMLKEKLGYKSHWTSIFKEEVIIIENKRNGQSSTIED